MACRKAGVKPRPNALRWVGSTGAPLPADGFRWVSEVVGVPVNSICGGTDICTAFIGASPLQPVRAGEIGGRLLGCAVEAFTPDGEVCPPGVTGELVITKPMPSMPVGFWGDPDGTKYRAAYFEDFPGVWRHGDWVTFTEDGSCVVSGRSDATLNRGGVRLGTSDFYAVVEGFDEVADSLVVHVEDAGDTGGLGELILFVKLADGFELTDDLRSPHPQGAGERAVAAAHPRRHRGGAGRAADAVGQEAGAAGQADPRRRHGRRRGRRGRPRRPEGARLLRHPRPAAVNVHISPCARFHMIFRLVVSQRSSDWPSTRGNLT